MSMSTRRHDAPTWLRIKMIATSRAHRAMKRQHLHLNAAFCPAVDAKFKEVVSGGLSLHELREWLGQVHTDAIGALEDTQVKLIKTRIQLRDAQRSIAQMHDAQVERGEYDF